MGEAPPVRCGYTWPEDHEIESSPRQQNCCWRESIEGAEHCIWHANSEKVSKSIEELVKARTPSEAQNENLRIGELLDGADLSGIDFGDKSSFEGVSLRDSDLSGADFENGNLNGAALTGADLSGVVLRGADLKEADFRDSGFTEDSFRTAGSYTSPIKDTEQTDSCLNSVDLSNAYLADATFSNADIPKADFTNACLSNTDFSNTNLSGTAFTNSSFSNTDFSDADLSGADLTGVDFSGADFCNSNLSGADLSGVEFFKPVFSNADLSRSNLTDANLFEADFSNADLSGSILTNADLTDADLTNAELKEADISGANLSLADFSNTNCWRSNLSGVDLTGADLSNAVLRNSSLNDSDMTGVNLHGADLEHAVFVRTNLFGADLSNTKPHGSTFTDVQINEDTVFRSKEQRTLDAKWWQKGPFFPLERCGYDPAISDNNNADISELGKAADTYQTSEKLARENAIPSLQSRMFILRQDMQRKRHWQNGSYFEWAFARLSRTMFKYGESLARITNCAIFIIIMFAGIYTQFDLITDANGTFVENPVDAIYFSMLTFTTLGLGDFQPSATSEVARLLVTSQAALGAIMIAIFVFVLGRRAAK